MTSESKPIVVIGSINIDFVVVADRIPRPGETIQGSAFETHFGGKGANQAVAIAKLGYPVEMIGMVGSDRYGGELRSGLSELQVGVEGVGTAPTTSGIASITVSKSGENSIVVIPGANHHVSPAHVDAYSHILSKAGMVLLQLEIPAATVAHVVDFCKAHDIRVMLDPAPARPVPRTTLAGVSWLTPNETEAQFLAAELESELANAESGLIAGAFLRSGVHGVALKQSARGVLLSWGGKQLRIPALRVNALDTTAAGDAFNGAFATALMLGLTPDRAAGFAAAAAAVSVTRRGAQSSMPTRHEVEEMLREVGDRPEALISGLT